MNRYSIKQMLQEITSLTPQIQTGQWIDVPLDSLPQENLERLWDNYSQTYTKHGLDLSVDSAEGLRSYTGVFLQDLDTPPDGLSDAFLIYKQKGSFGKKLSLLGTCQGPTLCDNLRQAKSSLVQKMFELLDTPGYFIEAGETIEAILSSSRPDLAFGQTPEQKAVVEAINGRKFVRWIQPGESLLDGKIVPEGDTSYYWRSLKSRPDFHVSKRIYGRPLG